MNLRLSSLFWWYGLYCNSANWAVSEQVSNSTLQSVLVERLPLNPVITPFMVPRSFSHSINGPSVLEVPDWLRNTENARYYMYFANHHGKGILLATAHAPQGPWVVRQTPVLMISELTMCRNHVASPDVHAELLPDQLQKRQLVMFLHCSINNKQQTIVVKSGDGLQWIAPESSAVIGAFYFRAFRVRTQLFALAKGSLYRAPSNTDMLNLGTKEWEKGPELLARARHTAVHVCDDRTGCRRPRWNWPRHGFNDRTGCRRLRWNWPRHGFNDRTGYR